MINKKYDKKQILAEFYSSLEFEGFKNALVSFEKGVRESNLDKILDSIDLIKNKNLLMKRKIDTLFKIKMDSFLTNEQIDQVIMESTDKGIDISYAKYIPSYLNEKRVYTTVDNRLLNINFKTKEIFVYSVNQKMETASNFKKEEIIEETSRIQKCKQVINELKENKISKRKVIDTIVEKRKMDISLLDKIKIMFNTELYREYLIEYNSIILDRTEHLEMLKDELKKIKEFDYEKTKRIMSDLQEGMIRRFMVLQFTLVYEDEVRRKNSYENKYEVENEKDLKELYTSALRGDFYNSNTEI